MTMETPDDARLPALRFPTDWRIKSLIALVILSAPAIWAGCSIAEDYETLSFWFDGVPTVEELEAKRLREQLLAEAEARGPLTSAERAAMLSVRVEEIFYSTHQPEEEKLCTECHVMTAANEGSSSGWISDYPELLYPPEELCLRCHEPPQGAFTHGPSASGNCALCHQSHRSLYPHLVRMKDVSELCKACHDPSDLLNPELHAENKDFACTACHDPHASEHEYLLHSDYPRIEQLPE